MVTSRRSQRRMGIRPQVALASASMAGPASIAETDPLPADLAVVAARVERRVTELLDSETGRWAAIDPDLLQPLEALREHFGDKVCRTVIRQSIAYAESAERAIPILDYRPDRGADYLSLAVKLLRRLGRHDLLEPLDRLSAEVVPAGARA